MRVARVRKRFTAGRPSAALRRSTTSSDIRSSSCAQTALSHATVSTPSRSATGSARLRERAPAAAGQARWTAASSVGGSSGRPARRARRRRAAGRGASRRGLAAAPAAAPSTIAIALDVRLLRAGHVRELGRGDHGLAVPAQQRRSRSRRVASSSHITSSSSSSGAAPRSAASSSRSASSSASSPRRCWPREP